MLDKCQASFLQAFFAAGQTYDDVPDALDRLRDAGYRLGVLANAVWGSPGDLWRQEVAARFGEAFDAAVFSTDAGYAMPDPTPYRKMAETLGLKLQDCLHVSAGSVSPAMRAGMPAVVMRRDETQWGIRGMGDLLSFLDLS